MQETFILLLSAVMKRIFLQSVPANFRSTVSVLQKQLKQTCVISDPIGQTHSADQ